MAEAARGIAQSRFLFRQADFLGAFSRDTIRWKLADSSQVRFLRTIVHDRPEGRKLWSNKHVRAAAFDGFVEAFLRDFAADEERKRYFLTFAWDAGFTWEREPVLDLVSLKNAVRLCIGRLGLHGIGIVEVDLLRNLTGEPGRRLAGHVHVYAWAQPGTKFRSKTVQDKLCESRAFPNFLNARSVVIKPIRRTEVSVARVAGYLVKYPSRAKRVLPDPKGISERVFRDSKLPRGSASRLAELLSHVEFGDVLFTVGPPGRHLKNQILARMKRQFASWARTETAPSSADVRMTWRLLRMMNGSRHFRPCKVVVKQKR
ncbi:hypothetical protein [Sphingomonas daechungensis]|uniref:hypothetical protein n=1 Tax=Sphingomonas daechungensis TaxID=1176646 RepID=UPI0031F0E291